jgi:hypothetical protein
VEEDRPALEAAEAFAWNLVFVRGVNANRAGTPREANPYLDDEVFGPAWSSDGITDRPQRWNE